MEGWAPVPGPEGVVLMCGQRQTPQAVCTLRAAGRESVVPLHWCDEGLPSPSLVTDACPYEANDCTCKCLLQEKERSFLGNSNVPVPGLHLYAEQGLEGDTGNSLEQWD